MTEDSDRADYVEDSYDSDYFSSYLLRSRVFGRYSGDKWIYRYWSRFLRRKLSHGAPVCELGCGLGFFGARVQDFFDYTGCDISDVALEGARRIHRIRRTVFVDAERELPFGNDEFAAVAAFDIVEHLRNPVRMFAEVYRILRPGGLFVMSTPNVRSLGVRLKSTSGKLVPSMYRDETHVTLQSEEKWLEDIRQGQLEILRHGTDGLWDIPYTKILPVVIQKAALIPLNMFVGSFVGIVPWSLGENLLVVAKKS